MQYSSQDALLAKVHGSRICNRIEREGPDEECASSRRCCLEKKR